MKSATLSRLQSKAQRLAHRADEAALAVYYFMVLAAILITLATVSFA